MFGRNLFMPGVIASVHLHPFDALDVVVGFKWSDGSRPRASSTSPPARRHRRAFQSQISSDRPGPRPPAARCRPPSNDQPGVIDSPPIWVPQLSLAMRFADRLQPQAERTRRRASKLPRATSKSSMADRALGPTTSFTTSPRSTTARSSTTRARPPASRITMDASGRGRRVDVSAGQCLQRDPMTDNCVGDREVRKTEWHGKDRSPSAVGRRLRPCPGLLALRAGVSYESPARMPGIARTCSVTCSSRVGLHAGFTLRLAGKTDALRLRPLHPREHPLAGLRRPSREAIRSTTRLPKYNLNPRHGALRTRTEPAPTSAVSTGIGRVESQRRASGYEGAPTT